MPERYGTPTVKTETTGRLRWSREEFKDVA
jgi:hypothetical protein